MRLAGQRSTVGCFDDVSYHAYLSSLSLSLALSLLLSFFLLSLFPLYLSLSLLLSFFLLSLALFLSPLSFSPISAYLSLSLISLSLSLSLSSLSFHSLSHSFSLLFFFSSLSLSLSFFFCPSLFFFFFLSMSDELALCRGARSARSRTCPPPPGHLYHVIDKGVFVYPGGGSSLRRGGYKWGSSGSALPLLPPTQ